MGMFYNLLNGSRAGGLLLSARDAATGAYAPPRVAWEQDYSPRWQVSTSLVYGRWTVLGSPCDPGPIACATTQRADSA